jgi:predicted Zn-dependent peptidase
MLNPVFREFYAERDVVAEERRMRVEVNPAGALAEAHLASAFRMHPYGVPVVGYMADLQVMSRQDVERYYRLYYGPNNAIVGIVGDLDPDQIEAWARKYFAAIPNAELPPVVTAVEPSQRGERRTELEWDAQPQLQIGWHVPTGTDPDAPSLAILSSLLTGGRTSRLYRSLVLESRAATAVFSSLGPGMRYPQLLQISATPRAPHTTMQLEELIYEELELLIQEGPTDSEIERVRNQISAGSVRRIQSNIGLAFQLVESVALFNDWRETFRYSDKLRAVTADDVMRIARTYLTRSNRTVTTLVKTENSR